MADSIDRVFAHALSTVRKIPRSGTLRPPTADRLRLYGLYKQSMEGDVASIMPRPLPSSLYDHPLASSAQTSSPTSFNDAPVHPDPSQFSSAELAEAERNATAEDKAEMEKWDAWKVCEGLTCTEAKRRYIITLIGTMRVYASGTREARELVEELEFVWEQVQANNSPGGNGSHGSQSRSLESGGSRREGDKGREGQARDRGLRVLRPMSDADEEELAVANEEALSEDDDYAARSVHAPDGASSGSGALGAPQWRRRVERALVQMTAEVAALRELVDATNSQKRLWARSRGKRGWLVWAWLAAWKLLKRALVDAAVVAAVLVLLRWRYREKAEEWWDWLGEFMGFVRKNVRREISSRKKDIGGLLGR